MKDMEGKVFDEEREQIFAQTKVCSIVNTLANFILAGYISRPSKIIVFWNL